MNATSTATKCHCCSGRVEGVQHLPICDRCLDVRLGQLGRSPAGPPRWTRALALGDVLRAAV